ncbi:MAG: hypothetical protein EOL89_14935, partial [Actinobacteria bacterium]|nr:hypothetical protein [Actinomycetota bacterium]
MYMSAAPRHASATRVDEDAAADPGRSDGAGRPDADATDDNATVEGSADMASGTVAGAPGRLWPRVLGHLLATLVLAAVALFTLEWVHAVNDPWVDAPERLAALKPWVIAVSGLAIWGFVGVLHALTGRLWLTTGLTLAGTAFIAFAD